MDIIVKLVGVIGAVSTVWGLFSIFTGYQDFNSGRKNDNGQKMDQGIQAMVYGGAQAAISAGVATAIIAALNAIHF